MKKKQLIERLDLCVAEGLCFVSLKPLILPCSSVLHFDLGMVNVNTTLVKYT